MDRALYASVAALALAAAAPCVAAAAGLPLEAPAPAYAPWTWTGPYAGVHAGGMLGDTSFTDHPNGASIFGNRARSPGFLFGVQAGYNWQAPGSRWVVGLEADISGADADGMITCLAYSGLVVPQNCRVNPQMLATVTARAGLALGPEGRTLLYAKGGGAVAHNEITATTNYRFNEPDLLQTRRSGTQWGWTVGGGIEHALSPAWSLRLEYNYMRLGSTDLATPGTSYSTPDGLDSGDILGSVVGVSQAIHLAKVALNYRFGVDPNAGWKDVPPPYATRAPRGLSMAAPAWDFEIGGRYFGSLNRFQWNVGLAENLISRLTYDNRKTDGGEAFARIDTPWNIFVKGSAGAGTTRSGRMNDEDFGLGGPAMPTEPFIGYTNTLHRKVDGHTRHATFDLGYTWLRGHDYKVGAFVGYHYMKEQMNAFGCEQIASPDNFGAPCARGNPGFQPVPTTGYAVITQGAEWHALRIGLGGEYRLSDRLRLSAEAAYIPYVSMTGKDQHFGANSGQLVHTSFIRGHGRGVQLEAAVAYDVTEQFALGVGARYSAMWTTEATFCQMPVGGVCSSPRTPLRAATEQATVFVQGSYRFGAGAGAPY